MKNQNLLLSTFLAGAALALQAISAQAIVNVEQAIIGRAGEGVRTTLDLSANGTTGNAEKNLSKMEVLSLWQHAQHTEFLQVQYAYGRTRGQVDTDRAFAHLRHRTATSADWAVEGFAQVGRDPFARLTQRALLGGGLRCILFEEDKVSAGYFGFGAFHERETLSDKLGTTDAVRVSLTRANSYLVLKRQLNEQLRVYNTLYFQPATADTTDYRVLEQASLLVKLSRGLDLKLNLDIAYDSRPPQTVQRRDMSYSTGLEFSF